MTSEDSIRIAELSDRDAAGEPLSAEERALLALWQAEEPSARVEARVWSELGEVGTRPGDADGDRRVADAAVQQVVALRAEARRRQARGRLWVASGISALAAAAAFAFLARGGEEQPVAVAPVVAPSAVLVVASGAVLAEGVPALSGARVARGSELSVSGGIACVELEPAMHACLSDGARARLTDIGGKERRLDVLAGRVAVSLHKLPLGERLSVVAGSTWSTAIGTAFTVERLVDGGVQTVVHEGKVRVGGDGTGELVPAHKIGLSQGGTVQVGEVTDHGATETPEWLALAKLSGRSIEEPRPVAVNVPEVVDPPASQVEPVKRSSGVERAAEPTARTATDLLSAARQALRDQRWEDAAAAYRVLAAEHPSSPEGRTALVPLAGLEIDRLGKPEQGLRRLENYLSSGGALAAEARLAKVRALRKLGRTADEARAIEEFVAAHPRALDVPRLNERLQTLQAR